MKILFVCHRFPYPPDRGGKIRPFHMIKELSAQGHAVTVASLVHSRTEERAGQGIDAYCADYIMERVTAVAATARMVAWLPSPVPSSMGYFYSRRLHARIRAALGSRQFDLILVHCSSMAQYVADVQGVFKVLDFGDMDSQKWLAYAQVRRFPMSMGFRIEGTKLQRAEAALARQFDYCVCATPAELSTLDSYGTQAQTGCVRNGVDGNHFHPAEAPYDRDTISFIGRMDYYPNAQGVVEFCERTLPLLRVRRPGLQLCIVGANPSRRVRRLSRLPGVTVTGTVPDVRPYVCRAVATIAPLTIARGTQNKVLESLALGVPVVASPEAARGVDAVPGEHFLVATRPEDYRDAIVRLAEDPVERQRLARAGRARMLSHHDWLVSVERFTAQLRDRMGDAFLQRA